MPVGELRGEDLAAMRPQVFAAVSQGSRAQALCALRAFLLWGAEQRLHRFTPELIRDALRPPGAAVGVAPTPR